MAARVLFVCTGNAGRSQMAQALFARHAAKDKIEVYSGGVEPWPDLHPMTRKLMAERGESLKGHYPKHVRTLADMPLDYIITIGEQALRQCPDMAGNPRCIHWAIDDPADADGTADSERVFRGALGKIEQRLPELLKMVGGLKTARQLHLEPGISTCITQPESFDPKRHLAAIAKTGFKIIELNSSYDDDEFDWKEPANIQIIKRVAADCGLTVWSMHAPIRPTDLGSVDEQAREAAVGMVKRTLDSASELGAQVVPFHPRIFHEAIAAGTHSTQAMQVSLDELCAYAWGLPCVLAWENEPKGMFRYSAGKVRELMPKYPVAALGLVCDTGHAHMCGDDTEEYLPAVGRRLRSWHLSDSYGQEDDHNVPGDGNIDWDMIAELGREAEFVGPLIMEIGQGRLGQLGPIHQAGLALAEKFRTKLENT